MTMRIGRAAKWLLWCAAAGTLGAIGCARQQPMLKTGDGMKLSKEAAPRPGWDKWMVFPGQGRYPNPIFNEDGKVVTKTGYLTDILTDSAVEFIEKKHDKPFCLYIGEKAWHVPAIPAERHKNLYTSD